MTAPRTVIAALAAATGSGRDRRGGARGALASLSRAGRDGAPPLGGALLPTAADRDWLTGLIDAVASGRAPGGRDGRDALTALATALPPPRAAPPAARRAWAPPPPAPPAHPDKPHGVAPRLWVGPLPAGASAADAARAVVAACEKWATTSAPPPTAVALAADATAAVLDYEDVTAAALAYETLAGADVGGATPARVFFCDAARGAAAPTAAHAFVPAVASADAEAATLAALTAGGAAPPTGLLRVGGAAPGVLLAFACWGDVADALAALDGGGGSGGGKAARAGSPLFRASDDGGGAGAPAAAPAAANGATTTPSTTLTWRGGLSKGGAPVCELTVVNAPTPRPGASSSAAAPSEPTAWPPILDVALRADRAHILAAHDPAAHAVVALALAPGSDSADRSRFIEFLNALASRSRAGVCEAGLGGRSVVLVPPSASVAARLGAAWEPQECVFAIVRPPA